MSPTNADIVAQVRKFVEQADDELARALAVMDDLGEFKDIPLVARARKDAVLAEQVACKAENIAEQLRTSSGPPIGGAT